MSFTLLVFVIILGLNSATRTSEIPEKGTLVKVLNPFPVTDVTERRVVFAQLPFDDTTMEKLASVPGFYTVKKGNEEPFKQEFICEQSIIASVVREFAPLPDIKSGEENKKEC